MAAKMAPSFRKRTSRLVGMHVDIHLGGVEPHVEDGQRETVGLAQSPICLLQGKGQVSVLDAMVVDHDDHVVTGGRCIAGGLIRLCTGGSWIASMAPAMAGS